MQTLDTFKQLELARQGSMSSLGNLLDAHHAYLLRVAKQYIDSQLRTKLSESDLVQTSLMVATRDFPAFRGTSLNEFQGWLLSILSHQIQSSYRRFSVGKKRRLAMEEKDGNEIMGGLADDQDSPSRIVSREEEVSRLLQAMLSLPDEMRLIIHYRYFEDLSFVECAQRLEISTSTCRRRWQEAAEILMQKLVADTDD